MKKKLLLAIVGACLVSTANAEYAVTQLTDNTPTDAKNAIEHFTITGTHLRDTSEQARIDKVTLTADDISALAVNSFADVLRGLPGVDVFQQGGAAGLTFLSLRGGDPNFVVVIIDGVKVNDPTNSRGGAFDLGTIDPAMIEKVELFYGSFSTVFGSDALAGVINITTKGRQADRLGSISLSIGDNDMTSAALHVAAPVMDVAEFSMTGSYQDGDDSTFGEHFLRKEIVASVSSINEQNTLWKVAGFYAQGHGQAFPEDSGGERLAIIAEPESRSFSQKNVSVQLEHFLTDRFSVMVNGTNSERDETIANPGIAPGVLDGVPAIDSQSYYQRKDFNLVGRYLWSTQLSSAFGVSYADEQGGMDSILDFGMPIPANYQLNRTSKALFAEAGIDILPQLTLTAGIRYDQTKTLSVTTHRVIGQYQLTKGGKLSAQYSEGFKLPSFFALAHPFVGNPALQPEQSKNYQLSVEDQWLDQKVMMKTSVYYNQFIDLVDFDPQLFTNVNRSKVTAKGIESSVSYQLNEQLSISAQLNYNDTQLADNSVKLRRRPKLKGSLSVSYQANDTLAFNARFISNNDYYDSAIPTGMVTLAGSAQLDFSSVWQINDDIALRLNVANVLDNRNEQAIGFKNYGRSSRLTLNYQF